MNCSERTGSEKKFKMKIHDYYVIQTHATPLHDMWISALDRSALLMPCG